MAKKTEKSKFISKDLSDLLNESQFMKNSTKPKKPQKRQQKAEEEVDEEDCQLNAEYQANCSAKKKKIINSADHKDTRQKLLEVMGRQLDTRKQGTETLLSSLSELLEQLEADYITLAENEQKLQHILGAFLKCVVQSAAAAKQRLQTLKEIYTAYNKQSKEEESQHKTENTKLADELQEHMNKLQQKLVSEAKHRQLENLRKSIYHAMQNDF